jgi:hypothetical protein
MNMNGPSPRASPALFSFCMNLEMCGQSLALILALPLTFPLAGISLDFGTQRVDSLLVLQRLALMGHWEEVEVKVSAALTAASKCGGFLLQSELVRLHCAATIALWDEDKEENATEEARARWLASVRQGFSKCIDISTRRGLVLLSLFAAVDWLRFEIECAQFEGVAFHPSLLLALSHTQVCTHMHVRKHSCGCFLHAHSCFKLCIAQVVAKR